MSLLVDAGACIAFERGDRVVQAFLLKALQTGEVVRTTTAVVAQVWRGGGRQARLAQLLRGVEEVELTAPRARAVGALLAKARTTDIADATLVELAHDGDEILTGDVGDIVHLAVHAKKTLIVTPLGA